jgi:hypothetical protein
MGTTNRQPAALTDADLEEIIAATIPERCPASVSRAHSPEPDADGCCTWCGLTMPPEAEDGGLPDWYVDATIRGRFRAERQPAGPAPTWGATP